MHMKKPLKTGFFKEIILVTSDVTVGITGDTLTPISHFNFYLLVSEINIKGQHPLTLQNWQCS